MMDTGATGRAGSAAATATILSVDHYGGDIQFYCVDSHASGGEATPLQLIHAHRGLRGAI